MVGDMEKYLVRPEDCVMLCIDIQEKLYAAMQNEFKGIFLKNSIIMLETAKAFNIPVILSEQYPRGLGRTIKEIACVTQGLPRFEKLHFSCFRAPSLQGELRKYAGKTVVVMGIEAHVCIYQSVLDLLKAGYRTVVISDAVCSRREHDRLCAIAAMDNAGAVICTTEMLAFMFLEKAGSETFKTLARHFR